MQQVVPSILPLKLKSLGASNLLIGILLTSAFPIFGMFMSPYLSFKSDYLRTRWGRRIPFLALSLPFVCASILLLAFSEDIAHFLYRSGLFPTISPITMAIIVVGVCTIAFQFADVLICSVYQYIFNDTVPVAVIGRFVGLMQMIGGAVGFLYNYFIFKYAEMHMKEIFIGTAGFYLIGIGAICLFVKEGEYPPLTENELKNSRGTAGFKTFFRETFSHKFYWTKFLYASSPTLIWVAISPFNIFFYREMGLTLEFVGKAIAITSVAGIAAAYISAVFIDRWHPLRILTYSSVFAVVFAMSNWVWLFVRLSPEAFFWLHLLGAGLIGTFHGTLSTVASMPFDIRLQPKSRYGQFCSAQSLLTNGSRILAGLAVGIFFDFLKWIFSGSDYVYRFNFLWITFWCTFAAVVICSLYRQWQKLGGDKHFHPPAPWTKEGFEEMEQSPFVGTQSRWLFCALSLIRWTMVLSVAYLVPLIFWLWANAWAQEFYWHIAILSASVLICFLWFKVDRSIRADVARGLAGEPLRNGIPHHGVFFVKSLALLLLLVVWIVKTGAAAHEGLRGGVLAFGVGNLFTNLLVIAAVCVLCKLERGFDPNLNYDGRNVPMPR